MVVAGIGFDAGLVASTRPALKARVGWGAYAMPRPGHIGTEWEAMLPHLRSGALDPVLGTTYPLEEAAAAIGSLETRQVTGKVLLLP